MFSFILGIKLNYKVSIDSYFKIIIFVLSNYCNNCKNNGIV